MCKINILSERTSRYFFFAANSLQNIVGDLLDVIEGEVEPCDVLGALHQVEGELVQAVRVHQVVVGQPDHVAVVSIHKMHEA